MSSAAPRRSRSSPVVMTDVAREAGVSQKTVSRVVNGSAQVSPEVRERVREVIDQLNYRPNESARSLVTRRTHVIGIVAMGSGLFGVTQHVLAIERSARVHGYGLVMVATGDGDVFGEVAAAVEQALAMGAEGLILVEPLMDGAEELARFTEIPLVNPAPGQNRLPHHTTVEADEVQGARLATAHLLDLGHASVHHVSGPAAWHSAAMRERGWRAELERRGVAEPPPVAGDWSARSGYLAARRLLGAARPTAIFAANDPMAMGVMRAVHEAGLAVGLDVSVVGFDDTPESEFQMVPLSSVRQDFATIARVSVERLVQMIDHGASEISDLVVPVTLVPRASSAPPRAGGALR